MLFGRNDPPAVTGLLIAGAIALTVLKSAHNKNVTE
jgi:hypothetical protein